MEKKGGTLTLRSLQDAVKEVFDIAGFAELFPMHDSEEAAIEECLAP